MKKILIAGGTGRTGRIIVTKLMANGLHPHLLIRDSVKAQDLFGAGINLHQVDIGDPEALLEPMRGMDAVISAMGTRTPVGKNCPKRVDYQGVVNLVRAAQMTQVKRFILISSIAVTHPEHPLNRFGRVLDWKFKSEEVLRQSGLSYVIVRPGGLMDTTGGRQSLLIGQGDQIQGSLSRADLAEICLQALKDPFPTRVTFEVVETKKIGPRNWPSLFATLAPD